VESVWLTDPSSVILACDPSRLGGNVTGTVMGVPANLFMSLRVKHTCVEVARWLSRVGSAVVCSVV